jgi:tRNA 2-selenouridine synthase
LTHILNEIGWRAAQLDGGYRAYRRHVVAELTRLPALIPVEVICGLTGSGKSRLLAALSTAGAQALDLEALAKHRGSSLGDLPNDPQPSQKDSKRISAPRSRASIPHGRFTSNRRPEDRRLCRCPMRCSSDAPRQMHPRRHTANAARQLLKDEYAHFLADPARCRRALRISSCCLAGKRSSAGEGRRSAGDWDTLVRELLVCHYDPMYARSMAKNYPNAAHAIIACRQTRLTIMHLPTWCGKSRSP